MKMKLNNKLIALLFCAMSLGLVSCDNQDKDFPDYEGGISVYFPYQTPIRTIVLGSEEYDTSLDKQGKCKIMATMGGSVKGRNIAIKISLDNDLLKNVTMEDGTPVKAMPENYYSLSDNTINFNGKLNGGVEVQLTDAFFADPLSATNTYVIPVVMLSQTGADRILAGDYDKELLSQAPSRLDAGSWKVVPQDYMLYCVKYQNKYSSYYSRCGKYSANGAAAVQIPDESSAKYEGHFDPVVDGVDCHVTTKSLTETVYSVDHKVGEVSVKCDLLLTFDASDNCTITSLTEGVTVTGSGKFVAEGAKKAWGDKDRDLITLNYTLSAGANTVVCDESLVWKRSGVAPEELTVKYVAE